MLCSGCYTTYRPVSDFMHQVSFHQESVRDKQGLVFVWCSFGARGNSQWQNLAKHLFNIGGHVCALTVFAGWNHT